MFRIRLLAPPAAWLCVLCLALVPRVLRAGDSPMTPAQAQIDAARSALLRQTPSAKLFNSLAVGLTRRARETGDVAYYDEAGKALDEAARVEPDNLQTLRVSAWLAMGRHQFARAYDLTRAYDRRHREDSWNLSVMGDALMELGRYAQAEKTFQRMVDLRPGPASYSRVAYLREMRGDLDGAMEMMRAALSSTDLRESEDRAWLMVQIAHLQDLSEHLAEAEAGYQEALRVFPGYHYALAGLAELELRQGRPVPAASLAQQSIDAAPHAERYLILADALRALGREGEAGAAETTFEQLALKNVDNPDNENHDLVLYYLERRPAPDRALSIARLEATRRQDIHTLDRLALALDASGQPRAARHLMRHIVAVGTRDPLIVRHAVSMGILH